MMKTIIETYNVPPEELATASSFYVDMMIEPLEAIMKDFGCEEMANGKNGNLIIDKWLVSEDSWVL